MGYDLESYTRDIKISFNKEKFVLRIKSSKTLQFCPAIPNCNTYFGNTLRGKKNTLSPFHNRLEKPLIINITPAKVNHYK